MSNKEVLPVATALPTRGQCQDGPRPCPLVSCRHHLMLDAVNGFLRIHPKAAEAVGNRPLRTWSDDDTEAALRAMPCTCSLDVADLGSNGLQEVADLLGESRELTAFVEGRALVKAKYSELGRDEREVDNGPIFR